MKIILLLIALVCIFRSVSSTTLGVILQNGQDYCTQKYYNINPSTCDAVYLGCPPSSYGADPQINEFGNNAFATAPSDGNYVYLDIYWSYIQQIYPNGTQVNDVKSMVPQHCSSAGNTIFRIVAMEYDYAKKKAYGIALVPNNRDSTYDSKVVDLNLSTGECADVLTGIKGTSEKVPYTCCGKNNRPAYNQETGVFYYYGADSYPTNSRQFTVIAADIPNQKASIGFISSNIITGSGFLFVDPELGLFALGSSGRKDYAIYKLTTGWADMAQIKDEQVVALDSTLPIAVAYDPVSHHLYLMHSSTVVKTIDMKTRKLVTTCDLPKSLSGSSWQWSIILKP